MLSLDKTDNYNIITEFYNSDSAFISFFPKDVNHSVDLCIQKSLREFNEYKGAMSFFAIKSGGANVGYLALDEKINTVVGFFIMPEHRTSDVKNFMWEQINSKLKAPYYLSMVARNPRVIKYYEKQGGELIMTYPLRGDTIHLFKFKGAL